jgi:hypothetical protein
LFNGTNVFGTDGTVNRTGTRFNTSFTAETSYRLRLVNAAACDTHFKFSIDNHTMTVIANDLVPIQPYKTNILNIAMGEPDICFTRNFYANNNLGQRYDVIVKADQVSIAKNFWLCAIPQNACSENTNPTNVKGIIYYGDSPSTPSTTGYSYTDSCVDEDMSDFNPDCLGNSV